MSAVLNAELLKLRTTRTFFVLVAVAVALSLLVTVLSTLLDDEFAVEDARDLLTADFTGLFILLLGVMGMAGEWRHRTITGTVLAAPDRIRLLLAKVLALAAAGVVLSLLVTVAVMIASSAILSARGDEAPSIGDFFDVIWRNLLVAALMGAFGVCVGALIRNQVVAIVGLLVVSFVVEPMLLGLVPEVGRFGPTNGAPGGIQDIAFFDDDDDLLATGPAVLVMLAWIGVTFAAGAALLRGRDLV